MAETFNSYGENSFTRYMGLVLFISERRVGDQEADYVKQSLLNVGDGRLPASRKDIWW